MVETDNTAMVVDVADYEKLADDCSRWQQRAMDAEAELADLKALINTPQTVDYFEAVKLEAAHQQLRWGTKSDTGKIAPDWFWLVGFLLTKAVVAFIKDNNNEKGKHHIISSSAVLLNWHRYVTGEMTDMRPGIDPRELGIHG